MGDSTERTNGTDPLFVQYLELLKAHNQKVWDAFTKDFKGLFINIIKKTIFNANRHRIDECLNDIYSTILFKLPKCTAVNKGMFIGWIEIVAKHHLIDDLRKEIHLIEDPLDKAPPLPPPVEDNLLPKRKSALRSCIASLKPANRIIMELLNDDLKPEEIAVKLAIPIKTVYNRKERSIKKLSNIFKKRYSELVP